MLSRRVFLATASATALVPALATAKTAAGALPDATELAAQIRSGKTTSLRVVEAAIRRAEATQPTYNYLVSTDYDGARERARAFRPKPGQAFGGVPFLVKDLNDVIGMPTRDGAAIGKLAPVETKQDPMVDAFVQSGLVIFGKSSTPEFGFLPTTEPLAYGPTRNPWDPTRSAGGSSGGAAVAVALGVIPMAHANDGGGSIRMPASCCGVFGLKPTRGRVVRKSPYAGPIDLAMQGCVSRSVRDTVNLMAVVGKDAAPMLRPIGPVTAPIRRKLRIGLQMQGMNGIEPDPQVRAAIEDSAKLLEHLGHHVEPTEWAFEHRTFMADFMTYWSTSAARAVAFIADIVKKAPDATMLEPFTLEMARRLKDIPPAELQAAIGRLQAAGRAYDTWFERYDVILSPVIADLPAKLGYVAGDVPFDTLVERLSRYVSYTPIQNVSGAPAISVPLSWSREGLPIGTHLAGRFGDDATLLALALQLEQARPWAHLTPNPSTAGRGA
jgi:amidase